LAAVKLLVHGSWSSNYEKDDSFGGSDNLDGIGLGRGGR
jgi:hypothetical protein